MRRPSFRQISVALGVSVLLHSTIGAVWWLSVAERGSPHGSVDTLVDAPGDDVVLTVAIRERSPAPPTPANVEPPRNLSPMVRDVTPPTNNVGTVGFQEPAPPTPPTMVAQGMGMGTSAPAKFGALHGRLKPGKSITYVLDRSSSMSANDALKRAIGMLRASLEQQGYDVKFQIVAYNGGTQTFATSLQPATKTNIEQAATWLSELAPEGRSDHTQGLREGLSFGSDAVFILTDADDFTSRDVKTMTGYVKHRVVIHAAIIGTRADTGASALEQFTQSHGGTVRYHDGR